MRKNEIWVLSYFSLARFFEIWVLSYFSLARFFEIWVLGPENPSDLAMPPESIHCVILSLPSLLFGKPSIGKPSFLRFGFGCLRFWFGVFELFRTGPNKTKSCLVVSQIECLFEYAIDRLRALTTLWIRLFLCWHVLKCGGKKILLKATHARTSYTTIVKVKVNQRMFTFYFKINLWKEIILHWVAIIWLKNNAIKLSKSIKRYQKISKSISKCTELKKKEKWDVIKPYRSKTLPIWPLKRDSCTYTETMLRSELSWYL